MGYVEIGLLIFLFAFILCIPAEFMIVGEPWNLGEILEANPHFYPSYVRNVLLYSILPPAVGVALIVTGYIRERRTFLKWHIAVAGGIVLFWGVYTLQRVHDAYIDIMKLVTEYNVPIGNLVLPIYAAVGVAKLLWIFAGVISTHLHVFSMLRNEWRKCTGRPA